MADWIESEFGRLDVLVNSAGIAISDSVGDASLANYHTTFAVNVEGTLLGMQVALEFMQKPGQGLDHQPVLDRVAQGQSDHGVLWREQGGSGAFHPQHRAPECPHRQRHPDQRGAPRV